MITAPPAMATKLAPGDLAPDYSITTFDHQRVSSSALGGQVVILNFWATWCGPCKQELPTIDAYYRAHAAQGLRVFAVATEDSVPQYKLEPLARLLGFPLASRIQGKGFKELEGVPTNYVIDRRGIVRYAKAAAFDEQSLDEVVGPLLAEPSPEPVASATP